MENWLMTKLRNDLWDLWKRNTFIKDVNTTKAWIMFRQVFLPAVNENINWNSTDFTLITQFAQQVPARE